MVLTHIAWAAIVTSASMVSYDLQVRVWHCGSRFFVGWTKMFIEYNTANYEEANRIIRICFNCFDFVCSK